MYGAWAFILLTTLATSCHAYGDRSSMKLGPPEITEALHSQPDDVLQFIVRGKLAGLGATRDLVTSYPKVGKIHNLPLIDGIGVELRAKDAKVLSERTDIIQVWYLHHWLYDEYINIIKSMEYVINTVPSPTVINISLGPPSALMPMPAHIEEPMNVATRYLAERGYIPILAIGNYYTPEHPNPGVVSPWCLPEWVICVGAVNRDRTAIYAQSARGLQSDPESWPDLVANGVDVISTWPSNLKKSKDRRQSDESNAHFISSISAEKRDIYSVMSGTSQATAQVSRAATQIVHFVKSVTAANAHVKAGERLFSLTIPENRFHGVERHAKRLTGDIGPATAKGTEVTYRLATPWKMVKQLLIDTTLPMPGFDPSAIGNGFVDPEYVDAQFGSFGRANGKILPVKAVP